MTVTLPTTKYDRDMKRMVEDLCSRHGVEARFDFGHNHPKIYLEKDGVTAIAHFSKTAGGESFERQLMIKKQDITRLFREKRWLVSEETTDDFAEKLAVLGTVKIETPNEPKAPPRVFEIGKKTVRGVEVPHVPDIAKGDSHAGKRSDDYTAFNVQRCEFALRCRQAGADWDEIIAGLARAGHTTNKAALTQAVRQYQHRTNKKIRPSTKRVAAIVQQPSILETPQKARDPEKLKHETEQITAAINVMVDELVERRFAERVAPLQAELDRLRKKEAEWEAIRDLIAGQPSVAEKER